MTGGKSGALQERKELSFSLLFYVVIIYNSFIKSKIFLGC